MKKTLGTLSAFFTVILVSSLQFFTSSCTKEVISDTIYSEYETLLRGIDEDLWAYFPINGSLLDSSGNGNHLTLHDGAFLSYDRFGAVNSAISFDGDNGYASIPEGKQFNSSEFTISAYVLTRAYRGAIFGKQNYQTGNGGTFAVAFSENGYTDKLQFSLAGNPTNICASASTPTYTAAQNGVLNFYQWYHVAVTHHEGMAKLYINGTAVDSSATVDELGFCNDAEFIFGSRWAEDKMAFSGKLDNIRIYERALDPLEVKVLTIRDNPLDYVEKSKLFLLTSKSWIYDVYYDNFNSSFSRLLYKRGRSVNQLNLNNDYIKFNTDGTFVRKDHFGDTKTGTWSFVDNDTKVRSVEDGDEHTSTIVALSYDQYVFYDVYHGTYGEMVPQR